MISAKCGDLGAASRGARCDRARVAQTPTGPVVVVPWQYDHKDCPEGGTLAPTLNPPRGQPISLCFLLGNLSNCPSVAVPPHRPSR